MFDGDIMIPLDIMLKEKGANKIVKILHTIVWIVLCMLVTSDLIEWSNNTSLGFPTVRVTLFAICSVLWYANPVLDALKMVSVYNELSETAGKYKLSYGVQKDKFVLYSMVYSIVLCVLMILSLTSVVFIMSSMKWLGVFFVGLVLLVLLGAFWVVSKIGENKVIVSSNLQNVYDALYNCADYQGDLFKDFEDKLRA